MIQICYTIYVYGIFIDISLIFSYIFVMIFSIFSYIDIFDIFV